MRSLAAGSWYSCSMFALYDLTVLLAVAENGSVRRAAVALGRTQPAVSQAIQRLEAAVGFALLDRTSYRARLTERGETFLERARATVGHARELGRLASALSHGSEPRLRLAVHGAVPIDGWLHLLEDLESCLPHTMTEIQVGEGDAPMRRLMRDEADLAIVLHPSTHRHAPGLTFRFLGQLEFATVVCAKRLVSNLDDDLASLPQILVADFEDASARFGVVEGHRHWRVSDFSIKAALIMSGKGWGSVPVPLVSAALADGTLTTIAYRGMRPRSTHPYFLCRKLERAHGPAARFIWDRSEPCSHLQR